VNKVTGPKSLFSTGEAIEVVKKAEARARQMVRSSIGQKR
jgi:hypothetical protein